MVLESGTSKSLDMTEILSKIRSGISQINRPLSAVERKELIKLLTK